MSLDVLALNCTLKHGNAASSTGRLLDEVMEAFKAQDASGCTIRVVDLDVKPGVSADEGPGDDWPDLRTRILAADIVVIGTPVWMGQPSSVAKRVLERMDAFISEADQHSRMPTHGKVAVVAVVGNEDGAHHCHAEIFQALNDIGFTIPMGGGTYWVGEAMGATDYKDLPEPAGKTRHTTRVLAANAAHLARLLKDAPYRGVAN
ncbi:NAD(P)H-dependent oxidoreductase [Ancylobacter sp. MQZ15Z-1]|uniref:NAD(P)H-dependent oxidoreductase n=1 Tax=Ancylobacter mangrovi TaxID=2972472 RepID=A0A9X2PBS2_9HYPH|nr:NAD(P)H-dependent oxidoreductase [Ancylobacter mangrovi]MCS0493981.1 NAD(P)H-dependent oxidoreductase [Ancylobacter mangrovi]